MLMSELWPAHCGRGLGGGSDNSHLQGEAYTHSEHSLPGSLREGALLREGPEAEISICSGIFLPLWRGIPG